MAQNVNKAITEIRYEIDIFYIKCNELIADSDFFAVTTLYWSAKKALSRIQGYISALNDVGMISDKEYMDFNDVVLTMFDETIDTLIR